MVRPTGLFTILKLQDQEIDKFHAAQERRATDFEALKLCKGRLGVVCVCTYTSTCYNRSDVVIS